MNHLDFENIKNMCAQIRIEIGNVIVGYTDVIDDFLTCLIARGHILLEGVPGIAKTTLAKTLAKVLGREYKRIQFTQDMLPADVTGHYYFDQQTNKFILRKGPIFADIVVADEINRASPKTQSALLEAMQERQVTIDGNTFKLNDPFMVIATINPIETEGVYNLPEAQLDRFMYRIKMDYVSSDEELQILYRKNRYENYDCKPVAKEFLSALDRYYRNVYVDKTILKYIRNLIEKTRNKKEIVLGASPRAGEYMLYASKAYALIHGRGYVIPDDVKTIAPKILNHRLILSMDTEMENISIDKIIRDVLEEVEIPKNKNY